MVPPFLWELSVACACGLAALALGERGCAGLSFLAQRRSAAILPASPPRCSLAVQLLVGTAALSTLGLLLCSAGFAPPAPAQQALLPAAPQRQLGALLGLLALRGLALLRRRWRRRPPPTVQPWGRWRAAALPLSCGAVLLALLPYCLLPPFRADEAMYHLSLPLAQLLAGGYAPLPGHGNGGFMGFGEMLFFWGLALGAPARRACGR